MKNSDYDNYTYDTTIPYLDFNVRKFTKKMTLIGIVFAQDVEEIDRFLFYIRVSHHYFESEKDYVINSFMSQINDDDIDWKEHFQEIFHWNNQEKFVSVLIFTRLINMYIIYLTEMANLVIKGSYPELISESKKVLRNFPRIKKCYTDYFDTPLYLTPADESFINQLVTLRNLLVHGIGVIPDDYLTKFENWKDLGCIKQDSDVFYLDFSFTELERFGNFITNSVTDIDSRMSEKFDIPSYYFDEDDIPDEYMQQTDYFDEFFDDFGEEEEE